MNRFFTSSLFFYVTLMVSVAEAQMKKIDTNHVSDQSFCVVRIDVERMMSHLKESKKSFEKLVEEFNRESGLDMNKLSAMTIQFGKSDGDDGRPSFAATFEFSDKIDKESFLSKGVGRSDFSEETINGKTYLKPNSRSEPHVYFETDRKFTMATPGAIEHILKAGGGMGKMSSDLKSVPPGAEIIVVYHRLEGIEESLEKIKDELKLPVYPELLKSIGKVESGFAYINLASSNPVVARLTMNSADSAQELQTGLNTLVEMGKTAVPGVKAFVAAQLEELKDAEGFVESQRESMQLAEKGLVLAEKLLAGLKITRQEKAVEIKARLMGGMTELPDLIVSGFTAAFFGLSANEGPALGAVEKEVAPVKEVRKN